MTVAAVSSDQDTRGQLESAESTSHSLTEKGRDGTTQEKKPSNHKIIIYEMKRDAIKLVPNAYGEQLAAGQ